MCGKVFSFNSDLLLLDKSMYFSKNNIIMYTPHQRSRERERERERKRERQREREGGRERAREREREREREQLST
jgi:hypothetical protein